MKRSQSQTLLRTVHAWLVAIVLTPIRLYSRFVSPALPRRCKFEPTCSAYAQDAIRELGIVRGSAAAAWRLMRCNPWSHGGWDPVSHRHPHRVHPGEPGSPA